jgi:PRC-barrel domain protein
VNRSIIIAVSACALCLGLNGVFAQPIAGSSQLGVTVTELQEIVTGWSTKRQILGQKVYNDQNEMVGTVDDVIVAPDRFLSYAIVGTGGFVGLGRHDVAIPVSQFALNGGKLVLDGATRNVIRKMPEFEYAH